jgi:amino-acid N-acetyltransferase
MSTLSLIDARELKSRSRPAAVGVVEMPTVESELTIRTACESDVDAIHRLVSQHVAEGRLLPRSRDEIASRAARFIVAVDRGRVVGCADLAPLSRHVAEGRLLPRSRDEIASRAARFIVAVDRGRVVGCADLAPLSRYVAEVRSLVVDNGARSCGIGRQLVTELERRALVSGFETLTAFTHTPGYFVQLGFSIVPHTWVPEKIEADCRNCSQFRHCGQYAVMLPLIRTQPARVASQFAHA